MNVDHCLVMGQWVMSCSLPNIACDVGFAKIRILVLLLYHFVQFGSHASRTPSRMPNSHARHADFGKVPKTFSKIQNFFFSFLNYLKKSVHDCWKKNCHISFGSMPKPKFWQMRHASRVLPNWTKWYSSRLYVRQQNNLLLKIVLLSSFW